MKSLDSSKSPERAARKKPRNAASLILYRKLEGQTEVLMGKRHIRAKFAPNVYVFPGGAVDRSDFTHLCGTVPHASHLGVGSNLALAHALLVAAIREAREETGLTLKSDVKVSCLRYLGRAITPVLSPVRYHARFFIADADQFEGDLLGDGELHHLHWVPIETALSYSLIDVTTFMLEELQRELLGNRTRFPLFTYYGNSPRVFYSAIQR
jgi:8-oxo-dGTP pyrophosphatase MutT (NUDIX family)